MNLQEQLALMNQLEQKLQYEFFVRNGEEKLVKCGSIHATADEWTDSESFTIIATSPEVRLFDDNGNLTTFIEEIFPFIQQKALLRQKASYTKRSVRKDSDGNDVVDADTGEVQYNEPKQYLTYVWKSKPVPVAKATAKVQKNPDIVEDVPF